MYVIRAPQREAANVQPFLLTLSRGSEPTAWPGAPWGGAENATQSRGSRVPGVLGFPGSREGFKNSRKSPKPREKRALNLLIKNYIYIFS